MPYVSSYFRRSAGAAAAGSAQQRRGPTVAIYSGASSTSFLRDRGRGEVLGLEYGTGLPGGFLDASFTLRSPAPKLWPVDTGQKVIIRLGDRIAWWGWVEDVRRRQRGRTEELGVTCLGPWQTLSQRRIPAVAYTSVYTGDTALKAELASYGTYVSSDYSQIMSTGVDLGDLTKSNWKVADLVKLVCEAGDSSNRPVLFALWEPGTRNDYLRGTNLIANPDFELGTTKPASWAYDTFYIIEDWSTTYYHSAARGFRWVNGTGDYAIYQNNIACSASTDYVLDFWVRRDAATWGVAHVDIEWKTSGGSAISTWTGPDILESNSPTGTWTHWVHPISSPATAAKFDINLHWVAGTDSRYVTWDDVYLYLADTAAASDKLPRAHLWARDLTSYDYLIHTARLANGLDVTESTRDLANAVLTSYGATPSYTAYAENGASQTDYRRRDYLVEAGDDAGAALAASLRDTYLAAYKDPRDEPGSFTVQDRRTITTRHGAPVDFELIRAGDRLLIADGPYAGRVFMVSSTRWSAGGLQITPERELGTTEMLART